VRRRTLLADLANRLELGRGHTSHPALGNKDRGQNTAQAIVSLLPLHPLGDVAVICTKGCRGWEHFNFYG